MPQKRQSLGSRRSRAGAASLPDRGAAPPPFHPQTSELCGPVLWQQFKGPRAPATIAATVTGAGTQGPFKSLGPRTVGPLLLPPHQRA